MKNKILLFTFSLVALFSCHTAYRSGQTPDDVYFSPARYEGEDDKKDEEDDSTMAQTNEDRQIRMKTRDRRWRELDNEYGYNYHYHPYYFAYNYGYYYNPYYCPYPVKNGINITNHPIRTTNLSSYNNTPVIIRDPKTGTVRNKPSRTYNQRNGTILREIFTPSGNGSGSGRTYSPGSSNSSGSSGSSGGSPVIRPVRTSN